MPPKCPICGSNKIAVYLKGMSAFSEKLQKDLDKGKVILGCCISDDDPFCACVDCKIEFYKQLNF